MGEKTENVHRRRSSLASNKRMTLHLQHLAEEYGVAPDADDRPPETRTRSYAPAVGSVQSVASVKPAVEEPTPAICLEDAKGPPVKIRSAFHNTMYSLAVSAPFNLFVVVVVVINTVQLILLTSPYEQVMHGWYFQFLDPIFLGIYVVELSIKCYALRLYFFKDAWNWFDMLIVVFCLVDNALYLVMATYEGFPGAKVLRLAKLFRVIRSLRAVRILRAIRLVAKLQSLMSTVLDSFKTLWTNFIVMIYFMYLFAVVGESFFGDVDHRFSSLPRTMWTLFDLLTCDDWYYMNMALEFKARPFAIVYFIFYIIILVYIFLSIFIAVLVDNFSRTVENLKIERKEKTRTTMLWIRVETLTLWQTITVKSPTKKSRSYWNSTCYW